MSKSSKKELGEKLPIPAFLIPGKRSARMKCLTPRLMFSAVDEASQAYEAKFGCLPPEFGEDFGGGLYNKANLIWAAVDKGVPLQEPICNSP